MKKIFAYLLTSLIFSSAVFAKDMRFVQVTDVRYSESNSANLQKVINEVNSLNDVEFVVFTGDNIERTKQKDLKDFIKQAKKLNCPFYVVLGDKDVYKLKEMGKKDYTEILKKNIRRYKKFATPNYTFVKENIAFIVVDGSKEVIPSTSGYYKDDVLGWLDSELKLHSDKHVVIFQHFPIIPPIQKETYFTYKSEKYLELLSKHNNVKSIISGHFGVNDEKEVGGIVHITTSPAPNYRIIDIIDYETETPTIWAQIKIAQ